MLPIHHPTEALGSGQAQNADRNILFLNLEGWNVRSKSDIDDLRKILIDTCKKAGKRVNSVINHDGFRIADHLYDTYAEMTEDLEVHYYGTTTRYATSAFLRLKMQEALRKRGIAPHIFERQEDAHRYLEAAVWARESNA